MVALTKCVFGLVASILISVSTNTHSTFAESIALPDFFGEWRENQVSCIQNKEQPALGFSHDGTGDYAFFGTAKCQLEFVKFAVFKIANQKKCLKSGFPQRYVGIYSLTLASDKNVIYGHMMLTDASGSSIQMLDCVAHRLGS